MQACERYALQEWSEAESHHMSVDSTKLNPTQPNPHQFSAEPGTMLLPTEVITRLNLKEDDIDMTAGDGSGHQELVVRYVDLPKVPAIFCDCVS